MRLHLLNYSNFIFIYIFLNKYQSIECNPITNANLSEHVREFAAKEDQINSTKVQTLQKEKPEYANFTPMRNLVKFKELPDSVLSSSSYSRGLVAHEHPGYAFHDYEEEPHYYGNEYHIPDSHHHGFHHHNVEHHTYGHHDGHHFDPHYKYNHALAAKTVLWPLAGLALLGAAAALVTNPILLQIGVATGKRRRRDTEEVLDPDIELNRKAWELRDAKYKDSGPNKEADVILRRIDKNSHMNKSYKSKQQIFLRDKRMTQASVARIDLKKPMKYIKEPDDLFIPVPLILNNVK